jgi:hypothetical protein
MGQSTFSRRNDVPATGKRTGLVWTRSPAGRFTGPATGGQTHHGDPVTRAHNTWTPHTHASTHVMPVLSRDGGVESSWMERNSGRPVRLYKESTTRCSVETYATLRRAFAML